MIVENVIKNGGTLIDVREEIELVADGSIDVAINIPLGEFEDRFEEIKEMPKPIVIFCRAGSRAQKAVDYCVANGLEDVHNAGGYEQVNEALSK